MSETVAPVTYTAKCQRVGRWWEITVPELDEVTQARTLDEVPATVADLVALMTGVDPGQVKVDVRAEVGPGIELGKMAMLAAGVAIAYIALRGLAGRSSSSRHRMAA